MQGDRVLVALALLLPGCRSSQDDVRERVVTSGRVHFASVVGRTPACAASPAWLDATMARQATFLGLSAPDAVVYHYRPFPTLLPCPGTVACTDSVTLDIYARPPDMTHELVHAIFDREIGPPASFFDEGAAVALGGSDWEGEPAPDYDQPLDPLLGAPDLPRSAYTLAGDFASYLLSTKGSDRYVDLLRHAPHGSGASAVRSAFSNAFGRSVDDLVSERRASGKHFTATRLAFPECSRDPIAWSGASWSDSVVVDCAGAAVGPVYDTEPPAARTFTALDVAAGGYYHMTLAAQGGFAWMHRCTDGGQLAFLSFENRPPGPGKREIFTALDAGRHFLRLQANIAAPETFTVEIDPTSSAGAGCSAPPPLDVAEDTNGLELFGGDREIVASIRAATTHVWTLQVSSGSALSQCDDPCTATTCIQLAAGSTVTLSQGAAYTFHLSGTHAALYR